MSKKAKDLMLQLFESIKHGDQEHQDWLYNELMLFAEEQPEQTDLKAITLWYSSQNGGDGSVYLDWFLTRDEAELDQDLMHEGWGEDCSGSIETFEGTDIHKEAIANVGRHYEK